MYEISLNLPEDLKEKCKSPCIPVKGDPENKPN
jgi:hypothetical protein